MRNWKQTNKIDDDDTNADADYSLLNFSFADNICNGTSFSTLTREVKFSIS